MLQLCEPERPSVQVHARVVPGVHAVTDVSLPASITALSVPGGVYIKHASVDAKIETEKAIATKREKLTKCTRDQGRERA